MFMTVETTDGQVYVGEVQSNRDGTITVRSGLRGHPVVLDPSDVVEVLPADRRNPHIEVVGAGR